MLQRLATVVAALSALGCTPSEARFDERFEEAFCEHQLECDFPVYADVATCRSALPPTHDDPTWNCRYQPTRASSCLGRLAGSCTDEGWARFSEVCYSVYECLPEETFRDLHAIITCAFQRDCDPAFESEFDGLDACVEQVVQSRPTPPPCYSERAAKACLRYLTSYHGPERCGFTEYPEVYEAQCGAVWACE